MADRNYIKQKAADNTSTEADKHVVTIDVTVPDEGRSGPYYPGDAKCIILVATYASVKFQMRGSGGTGGAADSVYRDLIMSAEMQTANATKVGVLNKGAIPHEFYLIDTSTGGGEDANPCTMTWIY